MNRNYLLCIDESLNRELLGSATLLTFFSLQKWNSTLCEVFASPKYHVYFILRANEDLGVS